MRVPNRIEPCTLFLRVSIVLVLALLPAFAPRAGAEGPAVSEQIAGTHLTLSVASAYDSASLRIVGPSGYRLDKSFAAGESISVDLLADARLGGDRNGERDVESADVGVAALPDGRYRYELACFDARGGSQKYGGAFMGFGGAARDRDAMRAELTGVREDLHTQTDPSDLLPIPETDATTEQYTITDGDDDGQAVLSLDSDSPSLDNYWHLRTTLNDLEILQDTDFTPSGISRMFFDRGLLYTGLGTAAPNGSLHILDDFSPELILQNTGGPEFELEATTTAFRILDSSDRRMFVVEEGGVSDQLVLADNGFVGLGTSNPTFPLQIQRSDGGGSGFLVKTTGAAANFEWYFQQNATTGAFLVSNIEGGAAGVQIFPNLPKSTLVVRGGKVGIGTQDPAGKLDVDGAIYQRGSVRHPDYVFEPEYELESIDQHSEAMWRDKHLPAVGAGLYDKEGRAVIDMAARSQGVLEELEKAHLYIEQLHRRLAALEGALATLTEGVAVAP